MHLPGRAARDLPHSIVGVDPTVPVEGIVPRGTEVLGRLLHALTDRVRGHALGSEQPGEARHEGRRHTCPAPLVVASRLAGGEYVSPWRGQIHPAAAAGEAGESTIRAGGADGDSPRISSRVPW